MSLTSRILWLLGGGALLSGCTDNVTCVFTTGCQGGSGAVSDNQAFLPVDGEWIVDGRPVVQDFFPSGTQNPGTTPVVLVFSESMQERSLTGAIEIVPLVGGGLPDIPLTGVAQALVCEGRVLVLLPSNANPLDPGDYVVRLGEQAVVLDLTGQELDLAPGARIGNFSVADPDPALPRLVTTFPAAGASNQGETTSLLVVFDRPVQAASITAASFDVRVGGVAPADDPPPTPVAAPSPDPRAFLYRSTDAGGRPVRLGTNVQVELRLSPTGAKITESDGDALAATTIRFQTLTFAAPLGSSLLSDPPDAIGLANLTPGDPEELTVEVDLDAAQPSDNLDLFLFGQQRSTDPNSPLIALQRTLRLTGTAPITSALFTRADVALQISSRPDDVRFEDGPVTFAFRARRGGIVTPLRVLDLDPAADTIQDPLLDTTVPVIGDLLGSNGTDEFRSDLRNLSLAGYTGANERLRSVEVTTLLGDNGPLAPVVGAGAGAGDAFLAAPVPLGIVSGGSTTYSFVPRDAAQNAAPTLSGAYTQVGVVGPDPLVPGGPLEIEVFDSRTLEPLAGARVILHSDPGTGVTFPFHQVGLTLADGTIGMVAAPVATIATVERAGYDLFTLHGVPSSHLSVPLEESRVPGARAAGAARTDDAGASAFLAGLDRRYDDSRRSVQLPRGFSGVPCGTVQGSLSCAYGPESIQEEQLGARSFFAGDFSQTEAGFSATQLLRAFALSVPCAPVVRNGLQAADLEVTRLLDDPATPPEEATQAIPAFTFRLDVSSGVNLLAVADDPATSGVLFADVEVLIPGLNGAIAVAQAISFDQGGNRWSVRGALPGAITAAGPLGADGIVAPDPFVRVEIADQEGNVAGVRPRLSTLVAGGANPELRALSAPTQLAPAPAAQTGAQAFTIALTHVIGDERSENQKGLYRVDLEDDQGRRWTLWRFDPPGAASVPIRVVDPADGGGVGLSDGSVQTSVSAYAWSSLSPTAFLWSDVEREFELFARAEPFSFGKP